MSAFPGGFEEVRDLFQPPGIKYTLFNTNAFFGGRGLVEPERDEAFFFFASPEECHVIDDCPLKINLRFKGAIINANRRAAKAARHPQSSKLQVQSSKFAHGQSTDS